MHELKTASSLLSPNQRLAVERLAEPVLILAGPGTGKTRVISAKILHLVAKGFLPTQILAMTFSKKAVAELEERIAHLAPNLIGKINISTIHALCVDLVQRFAFRLGLGRRCQMISEVQSNLLFRSIFSQTAAQAIHKRIPSEQLIEDYLSFFSECKDNGIWPEQLVSHAHRLPEVTNEEKILKSEWIAISETYQYFQSYCFDRGLLDFGDALMAATRLLEDHPMIRNEVQKEFRAILVDEFQDTSWIQIQLLRLLASSTTHVSVVGDDDQAIYRFRGASYSAFQYFGENFPNHQVVELSETYRLPNAVAVAATALIQKNGSHRFRAQKKIESLKADSQPVQVWQFGDYDHEASVIFDRIEKLLQSGVPAKEIAILARGHSHLELLANEAKLRSIPISLASAKSLYESPVIKDLLSFLGLVFQPNDSVAFMRLMDSPFLELSGDEIMAFAKEAQFRNQAYLPLLMTGLESLTLDAALKEKLIGFSKNLKGLIEKSYSVTLSQILFRIYESTKILSQLKTQGETARQELALFHAQIQEWESIQEKKDFRFLYPTLEAEIQNNQRLSDDVVTVNDNRISFLTVHASKGLEFEYVFVVSLVGRRFPGNFRKGAWALPEGFRHESPPNKESHEEEERRLLYVAMTRAKRELTLTCVSKKGTKPSHFLSNDLAGLPAQILNWKEWPMPSSLADRLEEKVAAFSRVRPILAEAPAKRPLHLSFTQLKDYEDCPQKFWFRYQLRIPTQPTPNMSLGSALHEALEHFYKRIGAEGVPSLEDLLALYKKSFQHFRKTDLQLNDDHEKIGDVALTQFYKLHEGHFVKPIAIEEKFKLEIGEHTLSGKIDRVDPSEGGVAIIDYKTGKSFSNTSEASERKAQSSLQFSIYALAAKEFFNWNLKEMIFYNLMDQSVLKTTRSDEDVSRTRNEIAALADKIQNRDFAAKPGLHCSWCEFRTICPDSNY